MNKKVIVIGGSGHGKVIADIIQKSGDTVIGFLDDKIQLPNYFAGIPILGAIEKFENYKEYPFVIAIGNTAIRQRLAERLKNVKWYTAIHPSAVISDLDVSIDVGTVIMANAVVNAGATIGRHCIINSGAIVEHDNKIEDFVHISVGAKLAGMVQVGKNTWIGAGATVSNNIRICNDCTIGAGAVVINNIKEEGTYVGVPVRKLEMEQMDKFLGDSY